MRERGSTSPSLRVAASNSGHPRNVDLKMMPKGDFLVKVKATDHPAEAGKADVIFVCLKAWQIEKIAAEVPVDDWPRYSGDPAAKLGLKLLIFSFPAWGQSAFSAASAIRFPRFWPRPHPGRRRDRIVLGRLTGPQSPARNGWTEFLKMCPGFPSPIPRISVKKCGKKFTWISSVGALGAITGSQWAYGKTSPASALFLKMYCGNPTLSRIQQGNPYMVEFCHEMRELNKLGISKPPCSAIWPPDNSELEYQIGAVVRLGKKLHIPTPASEAIYTTLLPSELQAQKGLPRTQAQG